MASVLSHCRRIISLLVPHTEVYLSFIVTAASSVAPRESRQQASPLDAPSLRRTAEDDSTENTERPAGSDQGTGLNKEDIELIADALETFDYQNKNRSSAVLKEVVDLLRKINGRFWSNDKTGRTIVVQERLLPHFVRLARSEYYDKRVPNLVFEAIHALALAVKVNFDKARKVLDDKAILDIVERLRDFHPHVRAAAAYFVAHLALRAGSVELKCLETSNATRYLYVAHHCGVRACLLPSLRYSHCRRFHFLFAESTIFTPLPLSNHCDTSSQQRRQ